MADIGGEPWFVAKDVCEALGMITSAGTPQWLRGLRSDEILMVGRSTLNLAQGSFPNRGANCISESALYKLILRSDKPQAKPFQDWVTRVVLPAIRKDGGYIMGEEKVAKRLFKPAREGLKVFNIPARIGDDERANFSTLRAARGDMLPYRAHNRLQTVDVLQRWEGHPVPNRLSLLIVCISRSEGPQMLAKHHHLRLA